MFRMKLYFNESGILLADLVEMNHVGSPESVKNHVIKRIGGNRSHIRVIVCTIDSIWYGDQQ